MINHSIAWFARRPAVANLLAALLVLGGLLSMTQTRQETLPNVPLERIGVVSTLSGSPEVVEQRLCTPLETAIYPVDGTRDIQSESRQGSCSITVFVVEGYNAGEVRDRIAARVENLDGLPSDASRPEVEEVVFRNRVSRLLLTGQVSPRELHRVAWQLRDQLLDDSHIAEVVLEGLPERELSVTVPRENLYRYQLSFAELVDSLDRQLTPVTAGRLRTQTSQSLIQAGQGVTDPSGYGYLPVRESHDGEWLPLEQVAEIDDGFGRHAIAAWLNGQPTVALDVYQSGNRSALDTAGAVRDFVQHAVVPEPLQLLLWEDDAVQYEERSDLLWGNALLGLAMLVLVLGVFFGLRLSSWVALGIPVAMLGACMILPILGDSFNTISLFAFILVLGIVVDDAVIVGESIEHESRTQGEGLASVIKGTQRIATPIVVAIITTIIAFTPMLFLPGPEGEFMRVVPTIAITILLLSLVECLWILPAHMHQVVSKPPGRSERFSAAVNQRFEAWVDTRCLPVLAAAMRQRYLVLTLFIGLFAISVALIHSGWINVTMFSDVEGDKVMADVSFPEGTSGDTVLAATRSLQETAVALQQQLRQEMGAEVIAAIHSEQGRRNNYSTAHDPSAELRARVTLALPPAGQRPKTARAIAQRWREAQGAIPGARSLRFHASLNEINPDIHINLYHPDLERLTAVSQRLAAHLEGVEGVFEIDDSMASRFSEVAISARPAARLAGMTEDRLGQQVHAAFHGTEVDRLPQGDHDVPVVLRLPEHQTVSLWHLEQLPITLGDTGEVAPLGVLANLERRMTPAVISHYNRNRNATVTAYVNQDHSSYGRVMRHLESTILKELEAEGITWGEAGKPPHIAEFVRYLSFSYAAALLLMLFVLTMMFGNYWQPFLILMAIPFGMVGALLGHALLGLGLSLWSVVGVVAVSGVVVNDNLVLIDRINYWRDQNRPAFESLIAALRERFRPIVLTTLTTFLAVAPLAFDTSVQARFLVPMAVSLGFGVLFASLITLLMMPGMYLVLMDAGEMLKTLGSRWRKVSEDDPVEQAYEAGRHAAAWGGGENPYQDDVLRASWEAGYNDAAEETNDRGRAPG
ncbi:MAG: efflux RND transporter permease subunit [Halomonadaceae bacterium]|nr:MAG: efflux RND transporter permease subunit [Halomonadaceae bacterium]